MIVRVVLAAAAVAITIALLGRFVDERTCNDARRALYADPAVHASAERRADAVATIARTCRGSDSLVGAGLALEALDRPVEARSVLRRAVRREPQSFTAWRALAAVSAGRQQRYTVRRARALNPRWPPLRDGGSIGPVAPAPRR